MAERVGFEPTEGLRLHLISSQARSTELRHLSAGAEASKDPAFARARHESLDTRRLVAAVPRVIRRPPALVLACAHLEGGPGDRRLAEPLSMTRSTRHEGLIRFGER